MKRDIFLIAHMSYLYRCEIKMHLMMSLLAMHVIAFAPHTYMQSCLYNDIKTLKFCATTRNSRAA